MFEHNIFIFDPQQFNNGKATTTVIMSYYQKEAEKIINEIDDTPFLEGLICDDDMRNFIKMNFQRIEMKKPFMKSLNPALAMTRSTALGGGTSFITLRPRQVSSWTCA